MGNFNQILINGEIVNKFVRINKMGIESILQFTIMTRYGDPDRGFNFPRVYFFRQDVEKYKSYSKGDFVFVRARMQSYDWSNLQGVRRVGSNIVGQELVPAYTIEEAFTQEFSPSYTEDLNQVLIRGKITAMDERDSGGWIATVETSDEIRENFPELVVRDIKSMSHFKEGDKILVKGYVETKKYDRRRGEMEEYIVAEVINRI